MAQDAYECGYLDIGCHVEHFGNWLLNVLLYVPRKLWDWLLQGVLAVLDAIPVPDWFSNAGNFMSGIDSYVWFFAHVAQVPAGIAIMLSAYTIRFLIRRIPLVG